MMAPMTDDFLMAFIGSSARARVLRTFVFNPSEAFTVRLLARRAGVSVDAAEEEVKSLGRAKVIRKSRFAIKLAHGGKNVVAGKQKEDTWTFDSNAKHAGALMKFVHEVTPVRYKKIVSTLKRGGRLATVVLSGTFIGDLSRPTDLLIAMEDLNEARLEQAVRSLEPLYGREIRYTVFTPPEFRYRLTIQDRLIRDTLDYPHLVLLDKTRLL